VDSVPYSIHQEEAVPHAEITSTSHSCFAHQLQSLHLTILQHAIADTGNFADTNIGRQSRLELKAEEKRNKLKVKECLTGGATWDTEGLKDAKERSFYKLAPLRFVRVSLSSIASIIIILHQTLTPASAKMLPRRLFSSPDSGILSAHLYQHLPPNLCEMLPLHHKWQPLAPISPSRN
jgi:hypothetical protein